MKDETKNDYDPLMNSVVHLYKQQKRTIEELENIIQEQQKTIDEQKKIIDNLNIFPNQENKKIVGFNYVLPEEKQLQIRKLRSEGYSYKKISLCFGISTSTAYKYSKN